MMKRMLFCLFLCFLMLTSVSCAGHYADTLSTADLCDKMLSVLDADTVYLLDAADQTNDFFPLPSYVDDHAVRYARDTGNLDEFGVYHVTEGHAKELQQMLSERYLAASYAANRDWYDSYIPAETPKLRDAEVRIFGNYVVYTILDADDRARVFDAVEEVLCEDVGT